MKNFLLIFLSFVLVFSFAACVPASSEPELPDEPSKPDVPSSEPEEEKDHSLLYEEMLLNFGARKDEDGKYRAEGDFSFYRSEISYENFHDFGPDDNVLYGIGSMIDEEELKEFTRDGQSLFKAFPCEVFEDTAYKYFGISAESLRKTIHYYDADGKGCYYPFGMVYNPEDPEIIVENIIENEDAITFYIKVDYKNGEYDTSGVLSVKILPDGGYNYVSYLPQEIKNKEVSYKFKLGPEGEETKISIGDTIGGWTLESIESKDGFTDAVFKGNAEVGCNILESPLASDEPVYLCKVIWNDFEKMPILAEDDRDSIHFNLFPEGEILDMLSSVPKGESHFFRVSLNEYHYFYGPAGIESTGTAEHVETASGLSVFYEDILLNFGGEINHLGKLATAKSLSLYYSDGFEDCSALSPSTYYSWMVERGPYDALPEMSLPGISVPVIVLPEEMFENAVYKFFGTPAEYLRNSEFYYPEQKCYYIDGHAGIGNIPLLKINSVDESADTLVFHVTLDYSVAWEENADMALTVKLLPNGGYNYISYMPE